MKFVFYAFIIWRLLLFIIVGNFSILPWANFDGVHYITIAINGYTFDGRFFPLYPFLIDLFSSLFNGHDRYLQSGFLISNLSFLFALLIFYKLVKEQFSEKIAKHSIIFMLIFPTSFYFGSIYSESLFLLLSLIAFYFAQKREWLFASVAGFFLGITRLTGIFILPSLIYEFKKREKYNVSKFLPLFLIPTGLIAFSIFCFYKWGDALYFIKAHGQLGNSRSVESIVLPFQTIYRYFNILTTVPSSKYDFWIAFFELAVFLLVSFLIYICWKKKFNLSYIIFALISFLLPVLSGTFSGLPRYVITIFPIFIAIALIKNKIFKFAYVIISPILLFLFMILFLKGYFVA